MTSGLSVIFMQVEGQKVAWLSNRRLLGLAASAPTHSPLQIGQPYHVKVMGGCIQERGRCSN
jgi:hypothetical protein